MYTKKLLGWSPLGDSSESTLMWLGFIYTFAAYQKCHEVLQESGTVNGVGYMDIQGLEPVVINICPLPSVMPSLGLDPAREEKELQISQAS